MIITDPSVSGSGTSPARARAPPRHLPDRVPGTLQGGQEPLTEMTAAAGDQYVQPPLCHRAEAPVMPAVDSMTGRIFFSSAS